jgi:hypothetical protein
MRMACWGFATGHSDHVGFLFACKFWPGTWSRMLIQRTQACLDKSFASTLNSCNPTVESGSNLVIRNSISRFKQDSRPVDFATGVFTTLKQLASLLSRIR